MKEPHDLDDKNTIPPEAVSAAYQLINSHHWQVLYPSGASKATAEHIIDRACRNYAARENTELRESRDAWQSKAIAEMAAYENKLTALRAELETAKEKRHQANARYLTRKREVAALREVILESFRRYHSVPSELANGDGDFLIEEPIRIANEALASTTQPRLVSRDVLEECVEALKSCGSNADDIDQSFDPTLVAVALTRARAELDK